jgi:hypothetical protein
VRTAKDEGGVGEKHVGITLRSDSKCLAGWQVTVNVTRHERGILYRVVSNILGADGGVGGSGYLSRLVERLDLAPKAALLCNPHSSFPLSYYSCTIPSSKDLSP